ncbi:MAG: mechanosensitive ion channel family protein [Dehalococcoidia bacterium]
MDISAWSIDSTRDRLLAVAAILVVAMLVSRVLQAVALRRVSDAERRYRLRKVISFVVWALAFMVALALLPGSLGQLTVALGVAGAGIAFALQEVIGSVAGWFAISFAGFYKPGDRVQLGGIKGDVIDIGLLRTTLMEVGEWVSADLYSGRIVRIANSFVFKEPVFNYSAEFPFLWDELMVPLKYGSDWQEARRVMLEAAEETVGEFGRNAAVTWRAELRRYVLEETSVEPSVTMRPTDGWLELRVRYVVDYRSRRWAQDLIFSNFLEAVDASEGRIGFASQTLQLIEGSMVRVDLDSEGASGGPPGG